MGQQAEIALSKIDASAPGRRLDALETLRIGLVPRRGCVFIETNATYFFLDFSYQHFFQLGSRQAAFRWRAELYPAKGNGPTSLFSPKQRMLGHIRAHYNRNIVPKWARRDHVLAQKVAELDSLLEMSAAGDCAPLEAKLLAISSQGSFQRELLG